MARAIEKRLPNGKAETMFKIPQSVLERHYKKKDIKQQGGQLALGEQPEKHLVGHLVLCVLWGYPMDKFDMCCIVKACLDRRGIQHKCFKNNMPGRDWVDSFLKLNKHLLAHRMCQNIKRLRAVISP